MQEIIKLIANNEDWLIKEIIKLAQEKDYTQYTSTLEEAWRIMIRGLSKPLITFLGGKGKLESVARDFAQKEARLHQNRGITLSRFFALLKCCRRGYRNLVFGHLEKPDKQLKYIDLSDEYFDYLENIILEEMGGIDDDSLIKKMQTQNKILTNEKNRFLTILESLSNPVWYFDKENKISWMNQAARDLAESMGDMALTYYMQDETIDTPRWLLESVSQFNSSDLHNKQYNKNLYTKTGNRYIEINLSRMVDISGKFTVKSKIVCKLPRLQKSIATCSP
ncbi:MAG: hypothetical protein GX352_04515 [Clostridiales bacterium]|nr:hypothetical protein [Clostridiales bacterium]